MVINTKDLTGTKVWIEKPKKKDPDATKKMGRVRACVFHPREKRCVGFIVKRPDLALMFHRKDLFVAYNGYDMVDGSVVVHTDPAATDKGACKALGVNWDDCVLWVGLPVMCQDGTDFGLVGNVSYDGETGAVIALDVTQGATANALLGVRRVPADMIRGFRRGMGAELAADDSEGGEDDEVMRGAILVDDEAKELVVEGGLAEKAGAGAAVVGDKAHRAVEAAKPKVSEAAAKGAYATGRQVKRASHMFTDFKEEFDKASGKTPATGAAAGGAVPAVPAGAAASASAVLDAGDDEVEYVFVDEDGNEVVYVDEDGNVITDPTLIDEEFAVEEVEPAATASTAQNAGAAVGAHLKKAGGMFAAFKEEYDKARHE